MTFTSPTAFDATHPTALAVYCSDGRFTQPVEDLLHHLGHARLDTLTMPGGPALLDRLSASYADADAVSRGARFLIEGHQIRDVVLLAHANCGYYRHKRPGDTPVQLEERQLADLRRARAAIAKVAPNLAVRCYFARPHAERVQFEVVE